MKNNRYNDQVILPPPSDTLFKSTFEGAKQFLDAVTKKKDIIVFSSHFDDGVLSMGSFLAFLSSLNKHISVVNVFTKGSDLNSDFTDKLIRQGACNNAEEYFLSRREEDRKAFKTLGIDLITYMGFTDAAWRGLYEKTVIGVKRHPKDEHLLREITEAIRTIIKYDDAVIFAPLGWGEHVDHVLVRDACSEVFKNAIFYADFPYLQKYKFEDMFIKKRKLYPVVWKGAYYDKKAQAILDYKSQNISLFMGKPMKLEYETLYIPETFL